MKSDVDRRRFRRSIQLRWLTGCLSAILLINFCFLIHSHMLRWMMCRDAASDCLKVWWCYRRWHLKWTKSPATLFFGGKMSSVNWMEKMRRERSMSRRHDSGGSSRLRLEAFWQFRVEIFQHYMTQTTELVIYQSEKSQNRFRQAFASLQNDFVWCSLTKISFPPRHSDLFRIGSGKSRRSFYYSTWSIEPRRDGMCQ